MAPKSTSLNGGVVGGVIGSPTLEPRLPESSVKLPYAESLPAAETGPVDRLTVLPNDVTALREKLARPLDGLLGDELDGCDCDSDD